MLKGDCFAYAGGPKVAFYLPCQAIFNKATGKVAEYDIAPIFSFAFSKKKADVFMDAWPVTHMMITWSNMVIN